MAILTLEKVSKSFGINKLLDDLSFSVEEQTIFGFIGKNGAGKTTTMKLILGLIKKDSGTIRVNGKEVEYGQTTTNQEIGYLADVPVFYDYMTASEYLIFCGELTGMPKQRIKEKISELLSLVGLSNEKERIKKFSRGMRQRLGIAQALLNEPKLLICDEPTSALDPVGRKEILDILSSVKVQTTILFSTHILSDVVRICDKVAFLDNGKIVLSGSVDELKKQTNASGFEIVFFSKKEREQFEELLPGGMIRSELRIAYPQKSKEEMLFAMDLLAEYQLPVQSVQMEEPTLEKLFLEVVQS